MVIKKLALFILLLNTSSNSLFAISESPSTLKRAQQKITKLAVNVREKASFVLHEHPNLILAWAIAGAAVGLHALYEPRRRALHHARAEAARAQILENRRRADELAAAPAPQLPAAPAVANAECPICCEEQRPLFDIHPRDPEHPEATPHQACTTCLRRLGNICPNCRLNLNTGRYPNAQQDPGTEGLANMFAQLMGMPNAHIHVVPMAALNRDPNAR